MCGHFLSDEPTLELSGILSTNSVMIPVAPVALPMPENVSVVGESLIPLVDTQPYTNGRYIEFV